MTRRIAIVGAGFSGTLVAVHLLEREAPSGCEVLLCERSGRFATGVAYGTEHAAHLLNMPAARMSAFVERPNDFVEFVLARDPEANGATFVPRALFGEYLIDRLARAERRGTKRGVSLRRLTGEVTDVLVAADGSLELTSTEDARGDGKSVERSLVAERIVLALGNFAPAPLVPEADPCHIADPWTVGALERWPDAPALLVGAGLTMLDVALAIAAKNPRVPMIALSRHGLAALAHRVNSAAPPARERPRGLDAWPRTARGLLRELRREVREAAQRGVDWREVIASLRADTAALWQALTLDERRRFLAHLRPFWEVHRHRAAPATAEGVARLVASGRLTLRAGRILGYRALESSAFPGGRAVEVTLRPRGTSATELLRVARVVNCTGPMTDLRRVREPLVCALLGAGLVRPDALGLGLDTDDDGAVLDATGSASRRLFAVGPLCKARAWEMTAVPELREAAQRVARELGRELAGNVAARRASA